MDREKIIKMVVILAAIVVIAASLGRMFSRNSMSLSEYALLNGDSSDSSGSQADTDVPHDASSETDEQENDSQPSQSPREASSDFAGQDEDNYVSSLTGASLNGASQLEQRVSLEEGFYYEPISDNLRRYMTGVSFPADAAWEEDSSEARPQITFDQLRYVHILHYDFHGEPAEGELVCNASIAQDLLEIFQELYRSEYQLESVLLIDAYDGDDTASMEENNTSCFNYRTVDDTDRLSKHAYGLAIDVNPLYNPYVTYTEDGSERISPASAASYADRSLSFPYKIDEDDLCYKLFIQHGFTWGGHWNNVKDYQHFQKTP